MKYYALLLAILLFLGIDSAFAYPGGDGSSGNPYQLSTPAHIDELMSTPTVWGKYFIVTQNIDCFGYTWTGGNPQPIGNSTDKFTGNFDGMGHTISNITYNLPSTDYVGFFGYISSGGEVSNLNLEKVNATGVENVGVFCGRNDDGSTIKNCNATGNANGTDRVGGFCGWNFNGATIKNCSATGDANGTDRVGGFCGWNYFIDATIINCSATGDANGTDRVGGFCGFNNTGATIENCIASGDATGSGEDIGGFCGWNFNGATIETSYSYGSATGNSNVGGFIGYNQSGNYTCCFWNSDANPTLEDSGNDGDLGAEVSSLTVTQFADKTNFACFDFDNTWIMAGGKPVLTALTIPTLSEWAVIIFIGLLAGVGGWFVWKRSA